MKKTFISFLLIISILSALSLPISAQEDNSPTVSEVNGYTIIEFFDGSTLTVSPAKDVTDTRSTVTSEKDATFVNTSGETEWIFTLRASFNYIYGVSSACTDANYYYTIYKGNWTFSNGYTVITTNTGVANGRFIMKFLFLTIHDITVNIDLVCDTYGNVV